MKFLKIDSNMKLRDLSDMVGSRNVESVLSLNQLTRTPNVGQAHKQLCADAYAKFASNYQSNNMMRAITIPKIDSQRKATILNSFVDNSDLFETAALLGESGWVVLNETGTFANTLRIPDTVSVPDSTQIMGNNVPIKNSVYKKAMDQISTRGSVDPGIFVDFDSAPDSRIAQYNPGTAPTELFQYFKIPWGKITLYSSLSGDSVDFPVYPEELKDGRVANYSTMPDMLYQYEPWQIYESSGPRSNTYTFNFHRDMWTGDHRDGKANELIRFCEANCYPEYNGSAVNTSLVTLYIAGQNHITGVMTDVTVSWDGPIGLDDWYLHCELEISITEVSKEALSYSSVRNKGLIG